MYERSWRSLIGCQFSSLHLWTIMECAYCMAIMLICLNVLLIFMIGSVNIVSKFFIDGICVVPLAPVANTTSGVNFQPFVMMLFMSGLYFMIYLSRVSVANLSLQYVNLMNNMVIYIKCRGFWWGVVIWMTL